MHTGGPLFPKPGVPCRFTTDGLYRLYRADHLVGVIGLDDRTATSRAN